MRNERNYGSRLLARGIRVSNNTFETNMNNNDLIFGTSGCGKTGGYIVPMLQDPAESMVVVDTKNNLVKMFSESLQKKGYNVHLIDFVNPKNSTCGYNPLAYLGQSTKKGFNVKDLRSLAQVFMPEMSSDDPYWSSAARKYITMLFCYVLVRLPKRQQNIKSVIQLHSNICGDAKAVKEELEHTFEELPADKSSRDSFFESICKQTFGLMSADRTWSCVLDFAGTALSVYDVEEFQYVFSKKKTFDFSMLGREKTVVFLNISDMDRAYDNLVNLFYMQLFQRLEAEAAKNPDGRLQVPVRIIMDDFASGTVIDDFDKIISVIRSREISVSLIIQSLSQLDSLYGEGKARTIINNCDHLLYMGGNDKDTLEFIAYRVNKPAAQIGLKPRDKMYLLTTGEPAALVDKIPPYSTLEPQAEDGETGA